MYDTKNENEINIAKKLPKDQEEDLRNSIDLDSLDQSTITPSIVKNTITKEAFKEKYEELLQLEDIIKKYTNDGSQNIICFFDIQGVLIKNNNFHEALASKKYEEILKDLCDKYNENYVKIARFGRFYESKLTEEFLPIILNSLYDINVELCLLTFARYSRDRENALKNHGILDHFQKQIWTGGISKGLVMMEYLKSKKELGDLTIIFVDDKVTHLKSVYDSINREMNHSYSSISIKELKLFLYNRDPVLPVNEQDFRKFWEKVIKQYKKSLCNLKKYR